MYALTIKLSFVAININGFGQEFPAAFQERHREKERAAWNKGASVLRHDFSF